MQSPPARTSKSLLFGVAEQACRELREHIAGSRVLTGAEIEVARGFVREASKESLYFFAKVVLGYDKMTGQTHKKWSEDLQEKFLQSRFFMRLKPRGTYKTTLYGISFLLWVWATVSPEVRFLYTSANQALLDDVSAEIDRFVGFKSESLFSLVFGIRRDADAQKNTQDVFNITGRSQSKGSSLMLRTAGGATNGVHPNIIIVDDPCDVADRDSEAIRRKKERWFDSLHPLLVPYELKHADGTVTQLERIMFIATRWHLQDLVTYVRAKSDDWDFEEEGVYLPSGAPRYPEFFGEEMIQAKKRNISDIFFACQYLNNPLPEGHRVFTESSLHFLRREQLDLTQGTNYCFFDPSAGKSGGDYPASIWVNLLNGRKAVFDAIDKKFGLTVTIGMIAQRNRDYRVRAIVFETNGALTMENTLVQAHKAIGHSMGYFPIHETRNKEERIAATQPDLYNGSWFLPEGWAELFPEMRNQILFYPAWGHDDFPDVLEKAVSWVAINMPGSFGSGNSGGGPKTLAQATNGRSW